MEKDTFRVARSVLPFAPLVAALALSLSYWPGLVTWDSVRQYDQALSGEFDDWHPPLMEWIWRQFLPVMHGPAPMLGLQLGFYAAGFALLILAAIRAGLRWRALAIGCCALLPIPIALMGTIIKDSLMAGALLCAAGLAATAAWERTGARAGLFLRVAGLLLCLFAAALRFNAVPAILPIAIWLLPASLWKMRGRGAAGLIALLAVLFAAMPLTNRLVGAKPSDVQLSLIIFDLGGITEHTHENQFPPLGLKNPVAINHRCYVPARWDPYSWWVDPCPIIFEGVRESFARHHINPRLFWLRAILHHPVAYAEHRLAHWNINARFLVKDEIERPVQVAAPPNDLGLGFTANSVVRIVDKVAVTSGSSPLGWPCVWMAMLAGLLWAAWGRRIPTAALVLAWSGLLYGLSYSVLSVASDLRYYLWTMVAGAIALVLACPDLVGGRSGWFAPLAKLAAPPLLLAFLCIAARTGLA